MKFNIGDRIRYCCDGSKNDGRTGVVINVTDNTINFPYYVSLDATETQSNKMFWTREDVLEPCVETFRDRLKLEHPEEVGDFLGGCNRCPYHYGYEPKPECCYSISERACRACWDRPIPTNVDYNTYRPDNITGCKRGSCKCSAIVNSSYKFCPNCGVRLEWGD